MLLVARAALWSAPRLSLLRPTLSSPFSSSSHLSLSSRFQRSPAPPHRRADREDRQDRNELDSYALSAKIRTLANSSSSLPLALSTLQSSPPYAATVVVWNVLLNSIFHFPSSALPSHLSSGTAAGETWRINQAWSVWRAMKQRGVHPSARSYGTFLAGAAKAAQAAERLKGSVAGRMGKVEAAGSISQEAMGRVETVHKQWLTHCEKVLDAAEVAEAGEMAGAVKKKTAPLVLPGLDVEFDSFGSSSSEGPTDGRLDTPSDLTPHPTNQYLVFLSSLLTLTSPSTTPSSSQALSHLLTIFSAMPLPSAPGAAENPLARNGVSYSLAFSALRTIIATPPSPTPTSSPASASTHTPASPTDASTSKPSAPPAVELIETGLSIYWELLSAPPPSAASQTSYPLTATHPTSLLTLFLSPFRSSSTLPAPLWATAVEHAQSAFGFLPPARVADLTPPHPAGLEKPLAKLDGPAMGTALRVVLSAGKGSWAKAWWDMTRDYPERFGLEVKEKEWEKEIANRENAEVVIKACGGCGDVEGIEDLLTHVSASPDHPPTVQTFAVALASLHRIGTVPALAAGLRVWDQLLAHSASSGSAPRHRRKTATEEAELEEGAEKVAKSGEVARKEHSAAASSLLRLALGVRDRSQVWRALKAVSGPFSPFPSPESTSSTYAPGSAPTISAFSPFLFPSTSGPSYRDSPTARRKDITLASALSTCLERLLRAPVDKFNLSSESSAEQLKAGLEAWDARIAAFLGEPTPSFDSTAPAGAEESTGEMARRRAALSLKTQDRRRLAETRKREYIAQREAIGKVGRRERRDGWIAKARSDWADKEVESEVYGRDARGRVQDGERKRPVWEKREEGEEHERPRRPHAYIPRADRQGRSMTDRPAYAYPQVDRRPEAPPRTGYSERASRSAEGSERPPRASYDSDRPPRSYSSDRPPRSSPSFSDRPARSSSSPSSYADRPPRSSSYSDRSDRRPDRSSRPDRGGGERKSFSRSGEGRSKPGRRERERDNEGGGGSRQKGWDEED